MAVDTRWFYANSLSLIMIQKAPLSFLVFIIFSSLVNTNLYGQSSLFSFEEYVNTRGEQLKYRQLVSDYAPDKRYPLVIFLHGSGERGDDNEAQLKWGVMNFASDEVMKMHPSIIIAPQCPSDSSWANISWPKINLEQKPTQPMQLVLELIEQLKTQMPVDTNRIYITGLSMGGFGTFDALMRKPDLFAAAVPVCGGGDSKKAADIAHIPMWIFHGAEDGAVDAALSREMVEALTKAGAYPGYTQYPEAGHFSWIAAYSDPMMMNFLYSQQKK
jgi:predicted peptidase